MFAPQTSPAREERFLRVEYQKEFFVVLILGMFTIALSSFPGLPILPSVASTRLNFARTRLFDPSSRVGSLTSYIVI